MFWSKRARAQRDEQEREAQQEANQQQQDVTEAKDEALAKMKQRALEELHRHWQDLARTLPRPPSPAILEAYKALLQETADTWDNYLARSSELAIDGRINSDRASRAIKVFFDRHIKGVIAQAVAEQSDEVLGIASAPNERVVSLPRDLRFQHTYIIGATGTGKTTLLKRLILADIRNGQGVTVLTPDRSFITDHLMPCLDERRIKDVIYFNPEDSDRPVTFNPLALQPYENIDRKADELLTLFKRAIGDTSPRMDAILRNSFYALLEREGSTLNDMYELLAPAKQELRNEIINTTQDEKTRDFFQSEYPTYPKDAARPILNRLDALTRASFLKNALCQPKSSLNFQEAMNQRKIVLCNLSDGAMGTQNATLLGQLLIASIQQALFARDTQPEAQRVPHFLYIDEFETYTATSTTALSEILTRARKLKFGITVAHQHLKQLPAELLAGLLGNVATLIAFRVSHDDAVKLAPHLTPHAEADERQEIIRSIATYRTGYALVRSGYETNALALAPDNSPASPNQVSEVMQSSREHYGQEPLKATPKAPQRTPEPEATAEPSPELPKQPKAVKEQKEKPAEFDPYQLE